MQRITFILLAFVAVCAHGGRIMPRLVPALDGRVVGGESTTVENFPYQVSVRLMGSHICGGTIWKSRVIVTAAHCIYSFMGATYYSIQYGTTVVGGTNNVINAERIVKHEGYDSSTINNDIAVIILSSDIPFTESAQPIALAKVTPAAGTTAVVSGWGTLQEGGNSASVLQQVSVEIIDKAQCQDSYADYSITESMLCAGVENGGKDACQGDSGGPLVCNGELCGVVSWGIGCARPDYPGVYTDVAAMRKWIEDNAI